MLVFNTPPPGPRRPLGPLALSITTDEALPRRRPLRVRRLLSGGHLIAIRDGLEYGHLDRLYREALHGQCRHLAYQAIGTPDPDEDPLGYLEAIWWDPDQRADIAMALHLERIGRTTPWPHGVLLTHARLRA